MRILVLGASGMAGHVIYRWLKETGHEVLSHVYRTPLDEESKILDVFKNADRLGRLIESRNPGLVINCIGLLPKACEESPAKAAYINSFLPHYLSTQVRTIHISTDCVFSGNIGSYMENSPKDAQDIYGISKSLGELNNRKDLTIRTSIVGPELKAYGSGLFSWYSRQTEGIHGWTNAFWNGVTTLELAQFVEHAIQKDLTGLCHLHSDSPVSKFHLLRLFKQIFGPDITIYPHQLPKQIDKELVSTREDVDWLATGIEAQLLALLAWYDRERLHGI